jgi:hypothetical protein
MVSALPTNPSHRAVLAVGEIAPEFEAKQVIFGREYEWKAAGT